MVGVSFKTTPINEREAIARKVSLRSLAELKVRGDLGDCELAILSTCNRVEAYGVGKNFNRVSNVLLSLFKESVDSRNFEPTYYAGRKALEHLFLVATGLDSLATGESQIISQIDDARISATEYSLIGPTLSFILQKAVSTGREARTNHPIYSDEIKSSISYSIAKLIEGGLIEKLESTPKRKQVRPNILVIGSGKMAQLAIQSLDKDKIGRIILASRRPLRREIGIDSKVDISQTARAIREEDIGAVISAISSEGYVLSEKHFDFPESGKEGSDGRHLLIVDMSFPRSVSPSVRDLENVTLYDLDDIAKYQARLQESESNHTPYYLLATKLAKARADECIQAMNEKNSGVMNTLSLLYKRAEIIRSGELENASRLGGLSAEQQRVVEMMSQRIVRRLLHEPTERLRATARKESIESARDSSEIIRHLFSLSD